MSEIKGKDNRSLKEKWLSRKTVQTSVIIILATVLCLLGHIDGWIWTTVVLGASGIYTEGNIRKAKVFKDEN